MNDKLAKNKNRKEKAPFALIPHCVLESHNYAKLSTSAVKLLLDLAYQYRGSNNGKLITSWYHLKKRGWRSPVTLHYAVDELMHYGFIVRTRVGGQNVLSLYAMTWKQVDSSEDLSLNTMYVKTGVTPHLYKLPAKGEYKRPKRKRKAKVVVLKGGKDKKKTGTKSDTD